MTETVHYDVIMVSGTATKGKGICRGVVLSLTELTIKEDFLPLDLGTLDVVLRMQWLQLMGKMEADWPALTLNFCRGGSELSPKGTQLWLDLKYP